MSQKAVGLLERRLKSLGYNAEFFGGANSGGVDVTFTHVKSGKQYTISGDADASATCCGVMELGSLSIPHSEKTLAPGTLSLMVEYFFAALKESMKAKRGKTSTNYGLTFMSNSKGPWVVADKVLAKMKRDYAIVSLFVNPNSGNRIKHYVAKFKQT